MNGTTIVSMPLDRITIGERLRGIDPDWVEAIAHSMHERGQDTPIIVGEAGPDDGLHPLIAGAHRVEAARRLGWAEIAAIVRAESGLAARLTEIDENLMRRELSALDRAVFLAERKAVYEALHPEAARPGPRNKIADKLVRNFVSSFAAATAAKVGLDERSIRRALVRARLPAEVRAAIATHPIADRGVELDRLVGLGPELQARVVAVLTDPERPARSVQEALIRLEAADGPAPHVVARRQFERLLAVWRAAGREARREFLAYLEAEGALGRRRDAA
jgi:ParB family chromosome partitioning protein